MEKKDGASNLYGSKKGFYEKNDEFNDHGNSSKNKNYEFHELGVINKSMNSIFIALNPKTPGSIHPKDFGPIITGQCLQDHGQKFYPIELGKCQTRSYFQYKVHFVKNRHILDEILIANQCVWGIGSYGRSGVVCKSGSRGSI